jgi:hypothetical protein
MTFLLDPSKVRELAKPSHASCHGRGITGYTGGGRSAIVCRCVWRALKAKGVHPGNASAVRKAIGREEEGHGVSAGN